MRKLDLRTGTPVWLADGVTRPATTRIRGDISVDVLIVGMGISGAMVADLLTEAGHSVAMVDRRGPMMGSTPATTALIQFEVDTPLTHLVKKIGKDNAVRAWRRSRLAVGNLRDRIGELDLHCHMHPRPTLYLAGNVLTGSALRDEAEARAEAGLPARYLTASQLRNDFGIDRAGAILSHGNLALDPVMLTAGLLRAATARGARLHAPEEVTRLVSHKDGVTALLASGPSINAGAVVLATGYELTSQAPSDRHRIISTWAIATRPQARSALWPGEALIWEASDPYLYLRTTQDGRVICGGEDADFSDETQRDALLEQKSRRISEKLARLLPNIDPTPEFEWAGSFGDTTTGLPLIGALPGKPRVFSLMGYGGNGVTWSRIGAELIRTALAGGPAHGGKDVDADLFAH